MKQTTIFDYFLDLPKQTHKKRYIIHKKIDASLQIKNRLINTYVQKTLSQLIKKQEEYQKVKDLLGSSWQRQENGFGSTDEKNIMIVAKIQDFNSNFFNLYKFEDFNQIIDLSFKIEDIKEDRNVNLIINEIEYNSYYLFKAIQILGDQIKFFQHKTLKLLYLKNSKFATLICPKF
ncbi:hypothetical protein LCGC14_0988410 [marine sediment metagenome]|uniref:Uncharacterized protein n=1 Tax=marine sediment metagenome TaxID=412755 RepID=A0A0F9QPW2_9ZZZZ